MWSFIHKIVSPRSSYRIAKLIAPWLAALTLICISYGLILGLLYAPADYQQGNVFRIMYIHVPAAIGSLAIYIAMAIAVSMSFIWKIKVADMAAKVAAPIGAWLTVLTLITGSIWGKPTWGTWWIWDARLTSELILLFLYLGVIAVRRAIPDERLAHKAAGLVTLIGAVNIPIIHYSVNWWNTLHQGSSISFFSQSSIAPSMMHPLVAMIFGFFFFVLWLGSINLRSELLRHESKTQWVKEIVLREST